MPEMPVKFIETDSQSSQPEEGIALCLSGGGYRAMLFHVGVVWRLYEAGILKGIKRISSVSGGSITAGVLALAWNRLSFDRMKMDSDFIPLIVSPIRALACDTIDADSVIFGLAFPGSISERVAAAYDKKIFKGATLQDLPDSPRFVINATNVQSGVLWRFMKPYMRDYRVGEIESPSLSLAKAVAASSAFPPVLSPLQLKFEEGDYTPNSGLDLQRRPFTTHVCLTDGGVYDNLGLETAWKRYRTILVSDAGGQMSPEEEPKIDWARHSYRVLNLIDNQVRALRKRQVVDSFISGDRTGAYWGIRTNIGDYKLSDALNCPHAKTLKLAETPTRLKRLDDDVQEKLINWRYAVSDAAVRKHLNPELSRPDNFPYPGAGV